MIDIPIDTEDYEHHAGDLQYARGIDGWYADRDLVRALEAAVDET